MRVCSAGQAAQWVKASGGVARSTSFISQPWLATLDTLAGLKPGTVVPSHGPVHTGLRGLQQTRDYLQWLDGSFSRWAALGWEMNEVLRAAPPEAFARWAAWPAEYTRNVAHLYPGYERAVLQRSKGP